MNEEDDMEGSIMHHLVLPLRNRFQIFVGAKPLGG